MRKCEVISLGMERLRVIEARNLIPAIPRLSRLMDTIVRSLIKKEDRLTGKELRMIRGHMGLEGTDFAALLGVARETLSRWENGHEAIGPQADRLVRVVVAQVKGIKDFAVDSLASIGENARPLSLTISP
jgi:DNA-binding transcriptional regulator YiaG